MNNTIAYNPRIWLDQFFTDFDKASSNTSVTFKPAVDISE
jgi:HSP20 family molecular chaperone IbpA